MTDWIQAVCAIVTLILTVYLACTNKDLKHQNNILKGHLEELKRQTVLEQERIEVLNHQSMPKFEIQYTDSRLILKNYGNEVQGIELTNNQGTLQLNGNIKTIPQTSPTRQNNGCTQRCDLSSSVLPQDLTKTSFTGTIAFEIRKDCKYSINFSKRENDNPNNFEFKKPIRIT